MTPASAAPIFVDDTFLDANWTASIQLDTQPSTTDPTFAAAQQATGGVANSPYRRTRHEYGPNNGSTSSAGLFVAHLSTPFVYDPATEGAIGTIDLSFFAAAFDVGASGAIAYGPVLFQDGSYYSGGLVNVVQRTFNPFAFSDLTAAGFQLLSGTGPANPDFSTGGTPITFGFATANGTGLGQRTSTLSGIDNYQLTVTVAPTAVPEPATLTLLCMGFGAAAAQRARRRARNTRSHR